MQRYHVALARAYLKGAQFFLVEFPLDQLPPEFTVGIVLSEDVTLLQ